MALPAYLPSSTQIGNRELADRVVHVPTLIGSSSGEGDVSRRATVHPADINSNQAISNDAQSDMLDQLTRPTSPAIPHRRTLARSVERDR